MRSRPHRFFAAAPCAGLLAALLIGLGGCGQPQPNERSTGAPQAAAKVSVGPPRYVGRSVCVDCHAEQEAAFAGSHHDLAMQEPDGQTVLGDFDNASFTYAGVTSTFFRRDGGFWVRTDNAEGGLEDFRVRYVFGAVPLQQYLIEQAGGRLQALSIAWDTRPESEGGQRFFHLYPQERIDHRDPLHWTGPFQNWNYMCADCHSTALERGWDPLAERFETTWQEIDVACEACHGPTSRHVDWAHRVEAEGYETPSDASAQDMGLLVQLKDQDGGSWVFDAGAANARRSVARSDSPELSICGPCHARRSPLGPSPEPGAPMLDAYRLALLEERLYYADGQILDEVYVLGSFLQSEMHHQGVTCSDCHDPHSQRVASGDLVCASCHRSDVYASSEHHFHQVGSAGAACLDCHMPARHYMVVDPRRDHSFRVPRPDLSVAIGVPNSCTDCHTDESAEWAARTVAQWFPRGRSGSPHWGEALAAARSSAADAESRLLAVIEDAAAPAIVRATALTELQAFLSTASLPVVEKNLSADQDLVRLAAVNALEATDPRYRTDRLFPLLDDPIRGVRFAAARLLVEAPPELVTGDRPARLAAALFELRAGHLANTNRADAHLNLGVLDQQLGDAAAAIARYRKALDLEPWHAPAAVNLAELLRRTGDDEQSEQVLRRTLERSPQDARLHHALGLALVRVGRLDEAIDSLKRAQELDPQRPRYAYVLAVALHDSGNKERALSVLEAGHLRHPGDRDVLFALVTYHRQAGKTEEALLYAERLLALAPSNAQLQALVAALREGPGV